MPLMEKVIDTCAYSREVGTAAFRYKNYGVIVHARDLIIFNADNEAAGVEVIDFLKNTLDSAGNITGKIKTY
jgi:hypothetical protein